MRTYTSFASADVRQLLDVLIDRATTPARYQAAMTQLGSRLGEAAADKLSESLADVGSTVCVACTAEDADFLARGFVEGLSRSGFASAQVKLICFWNERACQFSGHTEKAFNVAPVVKAYREPVDMAQSVLVVLKSIVSGACVVKTNLATAIDLAVPKKILVAAPVMLQGADATLSKEFPPHISGRFSYLSFAIDDLKSGNDVEPGIGGSVYETLAVDRSYVPALVKERRRVALTRSLE